MKTMLPYLSAYMGTCAALDTYYYIHLVPGLMEECPALHFLLPRHSCRRWESMNDFFDAVRCFLLDYLPKQRCLSENTIRSYKQTLNLFCVLYAE